MFSCHVRDRGHINHRDGVIDPINTKETILFVLDDDHEERPDVCERASRRGGRPDADPRVSCHVVPGGGGSWVSDWVFTLVTASCCF